MWCDPLWPSQHVLPSISSPGLVDPLKQVICVASNSASALMICWATASTMGITMAVVEVLLSHIDKKAVLLMNPNVSLKREGCQCGRWLLALPPLIFYCQGCCSGAGMSRFPKHGRLRFLTAMNSEDSHRQVGIKVAQVKGRDFTGLLSLEAVNISSPKTE